MAKQNDTAKGVAEGFYLWLEDHPVTAGDVIEDAVKGAVRAWLDDHSEEIIDAIKRVAGEGREGA